MKAVAQYPWHWKPCEPRYGNPRIPLCDWLKFFRGLNPEPGARLLLPPERELIDARPYLLVRVSKNYAPYFRGDYGLLAFDSGNPYSLALHEAMLAERLGIREPLPDRMYAAAEDGKPICVRGFKGRLLGLRFDLLARSGAVELGAVGKILVLNNVPEKDMPHTYLSGPLLGMDFLRQAGFGIFLQPGKANLRLGAGHEPFRSQHGSTMLYRL